MDKNLFIYYSRCGTCKKAKNWLDENKINYEIRDIVIDKPREEELKRWIKFAKFPRKKFFNTSGILYREMNLKDKLENMTEEEKIKLLSTDGKLVKRPLFINKNYILIGFNEKEWEEKIKN